MNKKLISAFFVGALLLGSTSALTSCKDYDDDINDLQNQIDQRALSTDLTSQINSLQSSLESAKSELQTAIATKADASTVTSLAAKVSSLESQLETANDDLAALEALLAKKVDQTEFNESIADIKATLATLTGDLSDETLARQAADTELQTQLDALNKFKQQIDEILADGNYTGTAADYMKEAYTNATAAEDWINANSTLPDDVADLKVEVQELEGLVTTANANLSTLTLFVEKMLTSIVLIPDLFDNGIETIEFKSLTYTPQVFENGELTNEPQATEVTVDNGMTLANYHLNPSAIDPKSIDSLNVKFEAITAKEKINYAGTRAVVESPVSVNGYTIKNGVMAVNCKKTITTSLNLADNAFYLIDLKVPRYNTDEETTTDIYSDYAKVIETSVSPKIAKLSWDTSDVLHHYSDSTAIYGSAIDANALVTKEIVYNDKTMDLSTLVTGSYEDGSSEVQITKNELKAYGLAFRFVIAKAAYQDVEHTTDQQQFAKINGNIILSQLPNGVTDNKAAIGKEPIVRVMLCDTVNNKLVDQKYLKIKWVAKVVAPVALPNKTMEITLPCTSTDAYILWKEFVEDIYAQVGNSGMSQSQFEAIYPAAQVTSTSVGNWDPDNDDVTFTPSTNTQGDATIATITIPASEIGTISQDPGYKDLVTNVTFKSVNEDYPDLTLQLTFRIKLPTIPSIVGYYDNYWYNKYDKVDIYPVQYNTARYTDLGLTYCEYNNNLLNPFTFNNATPKHFINNFTECGSWDVQFAYSQPMDDYVGTGTQNNNSPYTTSGSTSYSLYNGANASGVSINFTTRTGWGQVVGENDIVAKSGNSNMYSLINPLEGADNVGDAPTTTHNNPIAMQIWTKLNDYNYICIKNYNAYLVAPLKIVANLKGYFEEGLASGSEVDCANAFTMIDFRGYLVAKAASENTTEFYKYATNLYTYYQVQDPEWDLQNIVVGMKIENGSIVADNTVTAAQAKLHAADNTKGAGLTFSEIQAATNGNIALSVTPSGTKLIFKNNGGSNVEFSCNLFIPVSVSYGFGKLTEVVTIPLYPRGGVPQ